MVLFKEDILRISINAYNHHPMKLQIVIPIFNEAEGLPELRRRLADVCEKLEDTDWQVIYVNDGSSDESLNVMEAQHQEDARFTCITLSRNFGHQAALTAGLNHTDADAVVLMDGDLQDAPEVIPELLQTWKDGAEIVIAQYRSRQDAGLRGLGFGLFHRFFHWISDFPVTSHAGIFGLLDRCAVDELKQLKEKNRFLPGLRSWVGFEQRIIMIDRKERVAGEPKQTLGRLVRYAFDAVFSFSYKPLRIMTLGGLVICGAGFLLMIFYMLWLASGEGKPGSGFTTFVSLILFLGGIQLVSIGLLGEYMARIYDEVKRRPMYIVKKRMGVKADSSQPSPDE